MAEEKQTDKVVKINKKGKKETFELKDEEGKTIDKYLFQFPGVLKAQEIIDSSKTVAGAFVEKKYNELLMKHVIVEPKTDWDYWDTHDGYRRVLDAADTFLGEVLR
ncbi:MAG: hypothetical protein ACE3JK_01660 [Sporolactobacillus sp.]